MPSPLFPAVDHSEYKRSLYLECWNKLRMWEMTEWDRWASMAGCHLGGAGALIELNRPTAAGGLAAVGSSVDAQAVPLVLISPNPAASLLRPRTCGSVVT